jgi:hypothetical protein
MFMPPQSHDWGGSLLPRKRAKNMADRITWIVGKMAFPSDVDPAFIDWIEPLNPFKQNEPEQPPEQNQAARDGD